jgi:hypothetical protein
VIDENDILPTIGGFAIAVWHRIEPLVYEARRRENAFLFQNFEAVLPTCRECYVPSAAELRIESSLARRASHLAPSPESFWRRLWFSRFLSVLDFRTRRIGSAEAKRSFDENRSILLYVTRQPEREKIRGAIRPDPRHLSGWLAAVKEKDVITYCT